jgi:hypothetical protein
LRLVKSGPMPVITTLTEECTETLHL